MGGGGGAIAATAKIRLGGLKFSDECAHVVLAEAQAHPSAVTGLLRLLSRQKINLSYYGAIGSGAVQAAFCVSTDDLNRWQASATTLFPEWPSFPDAMRGAATLLLFPHQSRLSVLGGVLTVMAKHRLPLWSLGTSLSGIAVVTEARQLDRAAELLLQRFSLPANHAPFRAEPPEVDHGTLPPGASRLPVETAATYWERQIRVYGVNLQTDCTLTVVDLAAAHLEDAGRRLERSGAEGRFDLAVMQVHGDGYYLALVERCGGARCDLDSDFRGIDRRPVDLLSMHGPHFQDRYGVLLTALDSLQHHHIPVAAVSCTGSSIFLAVPQKKGEAAVAALTELFIVPKV
ncbi:hypothetical protein [Desulfofustis limnaeus]|uniref:Aspartate kinase n=1 Tax=Desulfofustis limnaeus TaxID=2740163 RepID=A0ABM7WBF8_9BACT|nr:hypothetical protein [Desulfofustis limnaeus]MDX9894242.1 hypothetical protein [Desulfofustis sp.]BDD88263.1 hypothetical protein DPPLL_26280 [Desulfofustis limnaeus]